MKREFVIDPEFQRITVPLTKDEREAFENSILSEGCLEPISVWNNIIIDGHKRYEFCSFEEIDFEEAIYGCEKEFTINIKDKCSDCNGLGGHNPKTCKNCNGRGRVISEQRTILGMFQTETTCPNCHGSGETFESNCSSCRATGVVSKKKTLKVRVPRGVDDGDQLRMAGKASSGTNGGPNGDVYIEFSIKEHPLYKRDKSDIYMNVPLTITEAILGCKKEINTIQGKVKVEIDAGTQNGDKIKIRGKGIDDEKLGRKGDTYLIYNVVIPTKLDKAQKKLIKDLKLEGGF